MVIIELIRKKNLNRIFGGSRISQPSKQSRMRDFCSSSRKTRSYANKTRLYFILTLQQTAQIQFYEGIVKHLKICLTMGTQPSAEIAFLQYITINTTPYTRFSHFTGYAIASLRDLGLESRSINAVIRDGKIPISTFR